MPDKPQYTRGYAKGGLPTNHSQGAKGKCPVCGFPYVLKVPTGNGGIYCHRNGWTHQVAYEK